MAVRTYPALKAALAAMFTTGGRNTAAEFRSFMVDVLDTIAAGTQTVPVTGTRTLVNGHNPITDVLTGTEKVLQVIVKKGTDTWYASFTESGSTLLISWIGPTVEDASIYIILTI